jgi:hypothetical protein
MNLAGIFGKWELVNRRIFLRWFHCYVRYRVDRSFSSAKLLNRQNQRLQQAVMLRPDEAVAFAGRLPLSFEVRDFDVLRDVANGAGAAARWRQSKSRCVVRRSSAPAILTDQVAHRFQYTVEGRQLAVFTAEINTTLIRRGENHNAINLEAGWTV